MKIIELKEKHPAIYKRAMECAKNYIIENGYNSTACDQRLLFNSFEFNNTVEGQKIWCYALLGDFTPFYKFHGLKEPKDKNIDWLKWILIAIVVSVISFGIYSAFQNFKLWTI